MPGFGYGMYGLFIGTLRTLFVTLTWPNGCGIIQEMMVTARPGAAAFPCHLKQILQVATAGAPGKLKARLNRELSRGYRDLANRRLANLLCRKREAMFTSFFLVRKLFLSLP